MLFFLLLNLYTEKRDSLKLERKVYSLDYKIDVPLTSVGIATAIWGFNTVDKKTPYYAEI